MQRLGLTLVQLTPAQQTLESSASKTLKGVRLAREYMSYGFTTLRDLGTAHPEWPTVDLRNGSTPDWWKAAARCRGAYPLWQCGALRPARLLQCSMEFAGFGHR
jgi:hypothetical protein